MNVFMIYGCHGIIFKFYRHLVTQKNMDFIDFKGKSE
jgi:hypothetical protein